MNIEFDAPYLWVPKAKILEPRDPVTMTIGVAGEFRLRTFRPDGKVHKDTGFFRNLITNQGLNQVHGGTFNVNSCSVGTGSTTPTVSDTHLANRVATTIAVESVIQGEVGSPGDPDFYRYIERTYRFDTGDAAGNLTEVGLTNSTAPQPVYCRALILDGFGSPTTLTVLPDEVLDVTYRLRIYPGSVSDVMTTISISGVDHDIVLRPAEMDGTNNMWRPGSGTSADFNIRMGHPISAGFGGGGHHQAYETTTLGAIDGRPAGSPEGSTSGENSAYTTDTFYRDFSGVWGLNAGNFAGGIGSIWARAGSGSASTGSACASYQFSLDPVIPKTNSQILTLNFRQSWARRTI